MKTKKRIGILTGGGDVQPLNVVISSARDSAKVHNIELLGFLNGWQGIINGSYVSLSRTKIPTNIGGTILRSSRLNVAKIENGVSLLQSNLEKIGVDGLIVIGGEDTLSNSFLLPDYPQVLISKTIDNDVGKLLQTKSIFTMSDVINHFTLGHPSAARKIASFISLQEGMRTTAYSHERIIVVESMGMHAGWLALSSCMAHPDFIIIPEFPLSRETFVQKVADRYTKNRNVIIVVAEGSRWSDGTYISADENEKDSFGHPRFKGVATIISETLKQDLAPRFNTRDVNSVNPSYLYRSGAPCDIDMKCASLLGKYAIQLLTDQMNEPIFLSLKLKKKKFGIVPIKLNSMTSIENFHRFISDRFYDSERLCATSDARKYWKTIAPEFSNVSYGIKEG